MRTPSMNSGFDALKIEGGLLSADVLQNMRAYNMPHQSAEEYKLAKGLKMSEELGRYWRIAKAYWSYFSEQRQREDIDLAQLTLNEWLLPLLREVLAFTDIEVSAVIQKGEREFPISHCACQGKVPLLLTTYGLELDKGELAYGEQGHKRSASGLVQEYLNAENQMLWGIVCNGIQLRIIRDNPAMTRPAFLEIDLQRMFDEEMYADFTVFWLLAHSSRFTPQNLQAEQCYLERWREQAANTGERVLENLRVGVTEALRQLGNGFISHPENEALRDKFQNGTLNKENYFQQLLRLVYRFLFLFTAEDRQILLLPEADEVAKKRYLHGYSLSNLREKARKRRHYDDYADCWQQLLITFTGFAAGQPDLAQPALGGLFAAEQCPDLEESQISNQFLLSALFQLSFFVNGKVLTRINYRDNDTEELGSVYESLLELIPDIKVNGRWRFQFIGDEDESANTKGHARKLTGSYYTPDDLVQELIKSALVPVIEERLRNNPQQRNKALLNIKVCDPACGSGHFLLAAARCLAGQLAKVMAGSDQPSEQHYRHALREVVNHCIYGVDLNPLAVELCKTALWLEALEPGKPLSFLDARIRHGNALVGVPTGSLMNKGIPDKAYTALSGDDKAICTILKKKNKANQLVSSGDIFAEFGEAVTLPAFTDLNELPEENLQQIQHKRRYWQSYRHSEGYRQTRLQEDLFTAAFFTEKSPETADKVPNNEDINCLRQNSQPRAEVLEWAQLLAERQHFFHWSIEFPEVFQESEQRRSGFDVLLGNPPWERIKLQEQEFFASRSPEIAQAQNAAARNKLIMKLSREEASAAEQTLYRQFIDAKHSAEATSAFVRHSQRFPLCGVGDVNLYAVFAENFLNLLSEQGRAGMIVPTGIATDDSTKAFFDKVATQQHLVSLFDFENKEAIFQGVHRSYKFCLLTLGYKIPQADFVFFATQTKQLEDRQRHFRLSADDITLLNPNTRTCPVFRSQQDAELTKKIYRQASVLIDENAAEGNPWGIKFQAMFHMSNDSGLFFSYERFLREGGNQDGSRWKLDGQTYVPLYEAKMAHQFDHRWATYETDGRTSRDATLVEKQQLDFSVRPRYWVNEWDVTQRITDLPKAIFTALEQRSVDEQQALESLCLLLAQWLAGYVKAQEQSNLEALGKSVVSKPLSQALNHLNAQNWLRGEKLYQDFRLTETEVEELSLSSNLWALMEEWITRKRRRWLLGWRDICRSTDVRTVISSILPPFGVGDKFLLIKPNETIHNITGLFANLNSLVFDFAARQKIGGTSLKYFTMKQLPVLTPDQYSKVNLDYITPRVLELTYTSHDLKGFAEDLGYTGQPFVFDPKRRHQLRCELDAYYARLYQLSRDELRYILDPADVMRDDYPSETFRVLKNKEMAEYGEYRTRRLILEAWDRLEQ